MNCSECDRECAGTFLFEGETKQQCSATCHDKRASLRKVEEWALEVNRRHSLQANAGCRQQSQRSRATDPYGMRNCRDHHVDREEYDATLARLADQTKLNDVLRAAHDALVTKCGDPYAEARHRNFERAQTQITVLQSENRDLLAENARLRRALEKKR